jgi:hypothetical protein
MDLLLFSEKKIEIDPLAARCFRPRIGALGMILVVVVERTIRVTLDAWDTPSDPMARGPRTYKELDPIVLEPTRLD